MSLGIVDLKNFDVTLLSAQFGSITLRNYGPNPVSVSIEPLSGGENLYNEKLGAFGDMMLNKDYRARNKLLRFRLLRNSPQYAQLQSILAAEEAGQSIIFALNARDSQTEESYTSPGGVLKQVPNFEQGVDVDGDVEYTAIMPNTVHIPPKLNLNVVANV